MKNSMICALIAALLSAGIAVAATNAPSISAAFGTSAQSLNAQEVRLNANSLFAKIDIDRDGIMSVDEYASQAVVIASLARFNGRIVIDGTETVHIALPQGAPTDVPRIEKMAIDTSARADYYKIAGTDALLTKKEWIASQMQNFVRNDRNEDGLLKHRELTDFTLTIAKLSTRNS